LQLQANDILVISGNSEATDLAEAKLIWDRNTQNFFAYFFFLVGGDLRVRSGAK
jgi:hypothetical protein